MHIHFTFGVHEPEDLGRLNQAILHDARDYFQQAPRSTNVCFKEGAANPESRVAAQRRAFRRGDSLFTSPSWVNGRPIRACAPRLGRRYQASIRVFARLGRAHLTLVGHAADMFGRDASVSHSVDKGAGAPLPTHRPFERLSNGETPSRDDYVRAVFVSMLESLLSSRGIARAERREQIVRALRGAPPLIWRP
jgi:hypothetical protein